MDHPRSGMGALHWVFLGAGATLVALVIAQFFPAIIPARAVGVKF